MKKILATLAALFVMTTATQAMSYEQARQQALFLTDKMAYELNLTEEQYEAAFEVNLDYLMSVNVVDDLYGVYWTRRNLDLSYILFDWQYAAFCDAAYFYRPLYWDAGIWHFRIYARYPHRSYFYFGRPHFWNVYRGGHSWHKNGGKSWYHGRSFGHRPGDKNPGMRDRFDRGDYKKGKPGNGNFNNNRRGNGRGGDMQRQGSDKQRNGGTQRFDNNRGSFGQPGNSGGSVKRGNTDRSSHGRVSSTRTTVGKTQTNTPEKAIKAGQETKTTPRSTFTPNRSGGTGSVRSSQPIQRQSSGLQRGTTRQATGSVSRSAGSSRSSSSSVSRGSQGGSTGGSRSGGGHFGGKR